MSPTKSKEPSLIPARKDMMEILNSLGDVGSVELKMNVPSEDRMALRSLDVDPLKGRLREVVFFDTPDLTLYKAGVVLRGRRTQDDADDTVVKLRPCMPNELPAAIRKSPNLKVEMDITRQSYVISASLKGSRPAGSVRNVLRGKANLGKLFTKEQRTFLVDRWPVGIGWDDLVPLGPVYVIIVKAVPPGFNHKLVFEMWHFPGEVPLVELSTKSAPADVFALRNEAVEYLGERGLKAVGEQEPKTRRALEFFAAKVVESQQLAPV